MDFKDIIITFGSVFSIGSIVGSALVYVIVGPNTSPQRKHVFQISVILVVILAFIIGLAAIIPNVPTAISTLARQFNRAVIATQTASTATVQADNTRTAKLSATATTEAIVAATAYPEIKAATDTLINPYFPDHSGKLILNDPLKDNSKGYKWGPGPGDNVTDCTFIANALYDSEETSSYFNTCIAQNTNYINFVYQVQMVIFHGDCGGIIFRAINKTNYFYYFEVCQGSSYALRVFTSSTSNSGKTLSDSNSVGNPKVTLHKDQPYLIAVIARGGGLDLYINLQLVISIFDTTFSQGQIGVASAYGANEPGQVAYTDAKVWTL